MADNFITFEDLELDDSFSFEEDCYINLIWRCLTVKKIAKRLNRSSDDVRDRIKKLGVRKEHEDLPFYYNNFILYYVKKYKGDFESAKKLAEFLGFDDKVVQKAIKILNCNDKSKINFEYNKAMNDKRKIHDIKKEEQKKIKELFKEYYEVYPSRFFEGAIGVKRISITTWKNNYSYCFCDKFYKRASVLVREDVYPIVLKLLECNRLDEVKALVDRETA